MANPGSNVLTSLKNKMQALREEMEKYRDLYEEKCAECQLIDKEKQDVGVTPKFT